MENQNLYDVVIKKDTLKNIKYNHKLNIARDMQVVIGWCDKYRILYKSEDQIVNPSDCRRKKVDPNVYTIFTVSNAKYKGRWGGNILYTDCIDNKDKIVEQKTFIRAKYSFSIVKADKAIRLLTDDQDTYNVMDIYAKINQIIDGEIKKHFLVTIKKNGYFKTQEKLLDIVSDLEEKLYIQQFNDYGIVVEDFIFTLENQKNN